MLHSDAATTELLPGSPKRVDHHSPVPPSSGVRSSMSTRVNRFALTDSQLALVVTAVLFVTGAWSLALTEVPPYQDLPNHLATVKVIQNPSSYPEYVFNGFFKTNAALFTWLYVVGKFAGLNLAARLFALLTLMLNALVLPRFVLRLTGSRARMVIASLFAWPMVHNWFVSMGMLDFAIAVPISLSLLLALNRQRLAPSLANGALIVALGTMTWYAHVFPLLVVILLVVIEAMVAPTWRARYRAGQAMLVPLLPVALLALASILMHVQDATGPLVRKVLAPWELAYNLWAEWFWGYSNLSLSSLVPCLGLALVAIVGLWRRSRSAAPPFFSHYAFVALVLLYCFLPYTMTNWFHVNSRIIPYFWVGLLLFVPERLPKAAVGVLVTAGALYSLGMGIDTVRLDQERKEFSAGMDAVPEGARLLPLLFKQKGASDNTRNLLHMWGYYTVERKTSAPLLFAHSHSFPVTYREPPPSRFNVLNLNSFAPSMSTPATMCRTAFRVDDCEALFRTSWQNFFAEAQPRYDHLLLWEPTPDVLSLIPADYERTFARGRLMIYARRDAVPRQATND